MDDHDDIPEQSGANDEYASNPAGPEEGARSAEESGTDHDTEGRFTEHPRGGDGSEGSEG